MQTSATGSVTGQQGQQTSTGTDAFNKLDMSSFLKMLVTELQSQDPMNPMDNTQILQQVSQIKAIASDEKLTESIDAMQLQQNVTTANGMLGRTISGLSDSQKNISGKVDSVSIADGVAKLHVGNDTVSLNNVSEILPTTTTSLASLFGAQ
jgi:flagellar basal-body rod modification protein FlgD